jgi:hypothetical protein
MTLSQNETQRFIDIVLANAKEHARMILFEELKLARNSEAEFCAGVIEHGPGLIYSSDQWFDFFSKIPNILFRHEKVLMDKLTPTQRAQLDFD